MKRKDPTLDEAAAQGYDCNGLEIYASVNPFYAVSNVEYDERARGYPIARDELSPSFSCRKDVPSELLNLRFKLVQNPKASKSALAKKTLPDAIHLARSGTDPRSDVIGISTIVSERCRAELEPVVGSECKFVETKLEGVAGRWFVMWVTTIIDPIDREKSKLDVLSWRENGDELLRPKRIAFNKNISEVKYLFRLSQWKYFKGGDMCRPAFMDLVKQANLKGFSWISAGGTGPFLAE